MVPLRRLLGQGLAYKGPRSLSEARNGLGGMLIWVAPQRGPQEGLRQFPLPPGSMRARLDFFVFLYLIRGRECGSTLSPYRLNTMEY